LEITPERFEYAGELTPGRQDRIPSCNPFRCNDPCRLKYRESKGPLRVLELGQAVWPVFLPVPWGFFGEMVFDRTAGERSLPPTMSRPTGRRPFRNASSKTTPRRADQNWKCRGLASGANGRLPSGRRAMAGTENARNARLVPASHCGPQTLTIAPSRYRKPVAIPASPVRGLQENFKLA